MRSFWRFFIRNGSFTILLAIVLTAAGIYSLIAIPKESSPEVQIPIGIVTTILPGGSAEDVERLITNKIEDRLIGLEDVNKVTSSSGNGVSAITVEFSANADIDRSIQLLKDEVDKVRPELPQEAEDPSVTDVNFADQPIMIISIAGDLAPGELTALGEELQAEVERVPGVSRVGVSGVRDRQVQVIVRQERLKQFGLSLPQVTSAIQASGLAVPVGAITIDGVDYDVRLDAGLQDPDQVRNIAIAGPGGAPIRVGDVATVIDGLENPSSFSRVSVNGEPSAPALTLSVFKSRGGNIVETGELVKEKLVSLEQTTLAGTGTVISYDASEQVRKDLSDLTTTGLETMVLIMLVLFITIGWRESLIAAASVPMSFLIAFIGMAYAGNTLNFISLFSLILAIGILVDSGIVVVEAIHARLRTMGDPRKAAFAAIEEYAWPLIAGTFTTVAVFFPLFFLSGVTGEFIKSIPFTVIFVLIASIFVALGLVPLAAMRAAKAELTPLEQKQEEYNERARAWYEEKLRGVLGDRKKENRIIWGLVGIFVVSMLLPVTGAVRVLFFPGEFQDFFTIDVEKPQGTALGATDLAIRDVEEALYDLEGVESFVAEVGAASAFGASAGSGGENRGNITVNLTDEGKEDTDKIMALVRERLTGTPGVDITVAAPEGGPPTGAAFEATFIGDDRLALTNSVAIAQRVLSDVPGVGEITTSVRDDNAEFVIRIDSAKAAALGVSPAVVAQTLRTAVFGQEAASVTQGTDDIEIVTKLDLNPSFTDPSQTNAAGIESIKNLTVPGANGAAIPVSAFAAIAYEPANATIRHEDGVRIATIQATLAPGGNAIQLSQEFEARMANEELPNGVTLRIGGESEDVNQSFREMGLALIAGLALMLAILVLEFNSFRKSFYLLSIVPLSLAGVMIGLLITGEPLSFPSMLGIIALAGVIINHAIILMDSIARFTRLHPEKNLTDIVVESASTRFRPIVLTTITTVVGMIPLSFVSDLWGPLAYTIMFGLAYSLLLTLLLIPILYHRWPGTPRYTESSGTSAV